MISESHECGLSLFLDSTSGTVWMFDSASMKLVQMDYDRVANSVGREKLEE